MCVYLDGSNAENTISLLAILCIIMYVTNKIKNKNRYFFFYKTDYGKMLKYREKYWSISNTNVLFIPISYILFIAIKIASNSPVNTDT